jgi:hypothetical protein
MALFNQFIKMEPISSGSLEGVGTARSAVGFFKMAGDMRIKKGADCAILDGAIVLQMQKNRPDQSRP